ncbi:hypothetical protein [Vibrio diazotrophicus]|nr:hypothetical protein [Vibrio diazotrophicus]
MLVACGSNSKTEASSDNGTPNEVMLAPQPVPESNYPTEHYADYWVTPIV